MIKIFLISCTLAITVASASLTACDGKGKLVEDGVQFDLTTK